MNSHIPSHSSGSPPLSKLPYYCGSTSYEYLIHSSQVARREANGCVPILTPGAPPAPPKSPAGSTPTWRLLLLLFSNCPERERKRNGTAEILQGPRNVNAAHKIYSRYTAAGRVRRRKAQAQTPFFLIFYRALRDQHSNTGCAQIPGGERGGGGDEEEEVAVEAPPEPSFLPPLGFYTLLPLPTPTSSAAADSLRLSVIRVAASG